MLLISHSSMAFSVAEEHPGALGGALGGARERPRERGAAAALVQKEEGRDVAACPLADPWLPTALF